MLRMGGFGRGECLRDTGGLQGCTLAPMPQIPQGVTTSSETPSRRSRAGSDQEGELTTRAQ